MTTISDAWIDKLPPFVSADTVARLFDVPKSRVMRWMQAENSELPSAKRPDNQYVTAREHVVTFAARLYGEMGHSVDREHRHYDEVPGAAEPERGSGDGVD